MDDKFYLIIAIKNCICVVAFVILAIVFNQWWISLCSLLFVTGIKMEKNKYYRVCDECGKKTPYADSHIGARIKAEKLGWLCKENGEDYCPNCKVMMKG